MKQRSLFTLLLLIFLVSLHDRGVLAQADTVHVFFSGGCADCLTYVEETLIPAMREAGVAGETAVHDFTRPEGRQLLGEKTAEVGLPSNINDALYAFVPLPGTDLVILGHVPRDLLQAVFSRDDLPPALVLQQRRMHLKPKEYRLWAFAGEMMRFPIDTPLGEALSQIEIPEAAAARRSQERANPATLLPAVVATGLLDSVNPCAFAVILLLLAFLFTIRQSRRQIIKLGGVFIGMIFVVYFGIGLGILQAVRVSGDPHFVARAGSWLLIGLGALNIIEYFWPQFPIKLHMPAAAHRKTNELLKVASVPATVVMGVVVGLCTFPCSGGIYVAIITLLNAKTTLAWGLGYLVLYNVLFVLPLIGILLAAGNRTTAKAWARWEREHALRIRLWYGVAMVLLGVIMLTWVI
jgi:cytochrome c biogenesis protein CcdA